MASGLLSLRVCSFSSPFYHVLVFCSADSQSDGYLLDIYERRGILQVTPLASRTKVGETRYHKSVYLQIRLFYAFEVMSVFSESRR
jgi:hypothetical protein